jgi:hypothetical protein
LSGAVACGRWTPHSCDSWMMRRWRSVGVSDRILSVRSASGEDSVVDCAAKLVVWWKEGRLEGVNQLVVDAISGVGTRHSADNVQTSLVEPRTMGDVLGPSAFRAKQIKGKRRRDLLMKSKRPQFSVGDVFRILRQVPARGLSGASTSPLRVPAGNVQTPVASRAQPPCHHCGLGLCSSQASPPTH